MEDVLTARDRAAADPRGHTDTGTDTGVFTRSVTSAQEKKEEQEINPAPLSCFLR